MTDDHAEFGRRNVLRKGAIASGALLLGAGTVAAGNHGARAGAGKKPAAASTHGKSGGVAYVPAPAKAIEGARFKIGKRLKQRLAHNASCGGHGAKKEYVAYSLLPPKKGKTVPAGVMYVNPKRDVATGGTQVYEFHNADACSPGTSASNKTAGAVTVSQANFRPTK